MTTEATDKGSAWENPLIPNAKLRQIYLAMKRARLLDGALSRSQRGGTLGLEASIVSTSVDLGPDDLITDALGGPVMDFLRGAKLDRVLRKGKTEGVRKRGIFDRSAADCGAGARLPDTLGIQERMWAAVGAAAALKARAAHVRIQAKAESDAAIQQGVVVMYAMAGEAPPRLWRKVLTFAGEQQLPVLFILLPATRARGNKSLGAKRVRVNAAAHGCGVPGIAVDADDAVAIYRVAQESIGRARIGGGAVLMECVPFVIEAASGRRNAASDAIAGLERYMLQRGVATRKWMEREVNSLVQRVAK